MTRISGDKLSQDAGTVRIVGPDSTPVAVEDHGGQVLVTLPSTDSDALAAHITDTTAAHAATAVAFTPVAPTAATTVQAAIEEVVTDQLARAVRTAAGVPAGAPTAAELRFAYDSTAVTGGFYYWNGAAWVKVATIL